MFDRHKDEINRMCCRQRRCLQKQWPNDDDMHEQIEDAAAHRTVPIRALL